MKRELLQKFRKNRGMIFFLGAILLFLQFPNCATTPEMVPGKSVSQETIPTPEEKWGLKILRVGLTAGGHMLDLRYQVTDPERASPLLDRKVKPYLIDQASGVKLQVPNMPKVGALKQRVDQADKEKTYFILFGNSRGIVRSGSLVTLILGDCRVENRVVE
jgi:hypothetical protein